MSAATDTRAITSPRPAYVPFRRVRKNATRILDTTADFVLFLWGLVESVRITRPRFVDSLDAFEQVMQIGWRPVVVVSVPIGMTFALNFDSLLGIIGLRNLVAAGLVPAIVREAGPLFGGIVTAATVGAAFCADIGARRVREEIAGSEVMAVDPRSRLYLPRIIGTMLGCPILGLFSTISALIGGWLLIVLLRAGSKGLFLNGFTVILRTEDILVLVLKGLMYGLVVGLIATFLGSRAKGGPSGVANATRASIMASFAVIVLVGFVINQFFYVT